MRFLELRWGLLIGAAGVVWLMLSHFLGMHRGLWLPLQFVTFVTMAIYLFGCALGAHRLLRAVPDATLKEALRSASIMVGVVALVAIAGQWIYFMWVNPGKTDDMVEMYRVYLRKAGEAPEQALNIAEASRSSYSMGAFMMQAGLMAMFIGMVSSAIALFIFIRKRDR